MRIPTSIAAGLALLGAACASDTGPGPMGSETIQASGTYDATFATTSTSEECGGAVPTGSTDGAVVVTQSATTATLRLTDVTDLIRNDPQGSYAAETGAFVFAGPITVGDDQTEIQAQGTIDGTFDAAGAMDLAFDFTALGCVVTGTIVGQRRG